MSTLYIRKLLLRPFEDNSYISSLPVVKHLLEVQELPFNKNVTFFVGENGTGKSTLIEAIAIAAGYNAEGGSRNFNFNTNHTVSPLSNYITLAKSGYEQDGFFLRAESFYNLASNIDDIKINLNGYGGKSLHDQSHGESFLSLVQNRFRGNGLYIMDEPEAALSPLRQLTLLAEMKRLTDIDSQFIIATHSPILLAYPDAQIYEISNAGINSIAYEDCEHVRLTKQFLNNPQKMLYYLFSE